MVKKFRMADLTPLIEEKLRRRTTLEDEIEKLNVALIAIDRKPTSQPAELSPEQFVQVPKMGRLLAQQDELEAEIRRYTGRLGEKHGEMSASTTS